MTNEQWAQVESIFDALREALPAARAARLAAIADVEVRREVASLLEYSSDNEGETVVAAVGAVAANLPPADRRIGPYRLGRRVGQGGQGAVFEAFRDDGTFDQRVAIKIVKWDIDTEITRDRFRQERQILAGLQHPHIGRLLDGGQADDGVPYLVMEFIDGKPITDATADWPIKRKLELFLKVCQAITYAHANLVIHRDLKPANILVTEDGDPKVLDFGIAKLLDPSATKTQTGLSALTPDYASPEQVRGLPISTSSDVYSLGVVLYQMLTSRKPYTVETSSAIEMDRVICQQPPLPPGLGDELDHILLMALRKEAERRYASVERFAEDVERYLTLRPVLARPDSTWYRARKYTRRQRVGLTWAAVALIALLAGTAQAIRAGWRADAEAATAKEINAFLEKDLLAQASGYQQPDPKITVKTALDRAAERIGTRFATQPRLEVSLRRTIARTYTELGLYPEARRHVERAVELDKRDLGDNARATLADRAELGRIDRLQARLAEAETGLKDVLVRQQRAFGAEDPDALDTMDTLGLVHVDSGKLSDAQQVLETVAKVRSRQTGPETRETLNTRGNLALVYDNEGKYQQAADLNRQLADAFARVYGPEHPETLIVLGNLAANYTHLAKYDQAEAIYQKTLDIKTRILGPEHPDTLQEIHNLTLSRVYQGRYREGLDRYRNLLEVRRRVQGPDHPETLMTMHNLVSQHHMLGLDAQGIPLATDLLERARRSLGPAHPITLLANDQLALAYMGVGRYPEAEMLLQQGIGVRRKTLGTLHPEQLTSMSRLAGLYRKQGKYTQAEPLQAEVVEGMRQAVGPEHANFLTSKVNLALTQHLLHKDAPAEALLRSVLPAYRERLADNWLRFRCESILGGTLASQGKFAEAEPLLSSGYRGMLQRKSTIPAESHFNIDNGFHWLADLYRQTNRPAKAMELQALASKTP